MSLQFALAPLGGGFLKQRDRLVGAGQSRQRNVKNRREMGRETETKILNTKSKCPEGSNRHAGCPSRDPAHPSRDPATLSRLRELREIPNRAQKVVKSNCKAKCENC